MGQGFDLLLVAYRTCLRQNEQMLRLSSCATVDDALALDMVVLPDGCHAFSNTGIICREQLPGCLHFLYSRCKALIQWYNLIVEYAQRALKTNGPATPCRL